MPFYGKFMYHSNEYYCCIAVLETVTVLMRLSSLFPMRDRGRKSVDMHLVLLCLHVTLAPARAKCVSERLLFYNMN